MGNRIKADKKNFVEALLSEAEEAALHENVRDLYNTTKKLSNFESLQKPERPVKGKQGRAIQGGEGQKSKWKKHF